MRSNQFKTLGVVLAAFMPLNAAHAQMIQRSSPSSTVTLSAPRQSTLPTIRMGSLPQRTWGSDFGGWDGSRHGFRSSDFCNSAWANCFSHRSRFGLAGIPYVAQTFVPYAVPYYVPVPVRQQRWGPTPMRIWQPSDYDPTKSRMLTIGAGVDGGGGVMRVEKVDSNTLRLTWRGSDRPIKEARLYILDSSQKTLRSARVDIDTPSAIFEIGELQGRIAFTGLTVTFADGAVQTTLVPYPPKEDPVP